MNSTIYRQYEGPWALKPYPTKSCMVRGAGCGLLACTHIAMEQEAKKNWTPENLRPWMLKQGFAIVNQGTTWNGITQTLHHIGHEHVTYITEATPMKTAFEELNKGNRIGIRTPDGTVWTGSGHYIMFGSYKYENGKHWFYMKDSGGRKHDGWYSYEKSMKGCVGQMWIVERIGKAVSSPKATTSNGKLVVDGIGGVATVKALQKFLGTTEDGVISSQNKNLKKYYPALKSVSYSDNPKGSAAIKMLQKLLGISPDGILGKTTVTALQKFLKVKESGTLDTATMKALQLYLNDPKAPTKKTEVKKEETKKTEVKKETAKATPIKKEVKKPTKAEIINAKALELAWPAGTDERLYRKKGGGPNAAFKKAWKKHFPKSKMNTGCHSYVRLVLRESGYSKAMPSLTWSKILKYLKANFKEIKVDYKQSQLKPGDIRVHRTDHSWHIWVIVEKNGKFYRAEANQGSKNDRYAHLNSSKAGNEKKHKQDWLFRAK